MKTLLVSLVVLGQSLLAVCPSGVCGVVEREAAAARPEATCCRPAEPAAPECPRQPTARCCCQQEATIPEARVKLAEAAVLPAPVPGEPAAAAPDALWPDGFLDSDRGPRLHVLQCVWRC